MRAVVQALRRSVRSAGGSHAGLAPWGLAAPRRGAAELAAAAACGAAAAGQPALREFLIYHWDKDAFQSHTIDIDRCARLAAARQRRHGNRVRFGWVVHVAAGQQRAVGPSGSGREAGQRVRSTWIGGCSLGPGSGVNAQPSPPRAAAPAGSCGPAPSLLDVLLRIQAEQDPSLVIRHGCRRGRCGACAAIVNGVSLLPCHTPVNRAVTGVGCQPVDGTLEGLAACVAPGAGIALLQPSFSLSLHPSAHPHRRTGVEGQRPAASHRAGRGKRLLLSGHGSRVMNIYALIAPIFAF